MLKWFLENKDCTTDAVTMSRCYPLSNLGLDKKVSLSSWDTLKESDQTSTMHKGSESTSSLCIEKTPLDHEQKYKTV